MIPNYDWIIFNGGLCFPSNNLDARINKVKHLMSTSKIIYVAGRMDYLSQDENIMPWIMSLPNVVIAEFATHRTIIMDGGVSSKVKELQDLEHNLEVSFISHIENKPWHQSYNGRLGYIISNNPLTNQFPQYYPYSMQLGNCYDGEIYAQEVDEIGLKRTFLI